jgi:Ca-activated chloride channel family protein
MLSTGVPIRGLVSPSHRMVIRSIGQGRAEMALADAERESGNRDFILRYRLGKSIGSALLLDKGRDESFFLLLAEPPQAVLPGGTQTAPPPSDLDSPVLTDINVTFRAFETYDVEPAGLPDLFARRPIVVFGKWRGDPWGSIEITGNTHPGTYLTCVAVTPEGSAGSRGALRHLWARARLDILSDFDPSIPDERRAARIQSLGLTSGVLTERTSFVAVRELVRRTTGDAVDVDHGR